MNTLASFELPFAGIQLKIAQADRAEQLLLDVTEPPK